MNEQDTKYPVHPDDYNWPDAYPNVPGIGEFAYEARIPRGAGAIGLAETTVGPQNSN
jgi:hypothetical protein